MSGRALVDDAVYPFRSRFVDLAAARMHYVDEGAGDPLLFVHGTPTWSFEWRHVIRALSPQWRCVAPDLVGFGLSERPRGFAYTPEAHAAAIADFVDRINMPPFTLVVHDFGGPIALPLCLRRPERVTRLVIINSWMWSFAGDHEMEKNARLAGGALGRFLYQWVNFSLRVLMPYAYGDRRQLTREIHRQYLDRFPDHWSRATVLWRLAHALLGSSNYYDSLWRQREQLRGRPALILWGMRDRAFRPNQLARWRDTLPDARIVELTNAGHWPHEEAPAQVITEFRAFLR